MSNSYHVTHVTTEDGQVRMAGQVVRCSKDAFADAVIMGFTEPDKFGDVYARISRPFASATCVGTICPGVALQVETFTISLESLMLMKLVEADGNRILGGLPAPDKRPYQDEKIDLRPPQTPQVNG